MMQSKRKQRRNLRPASPAEEEEGKATHEEGDRVRKGTHEYPSKLTGKKKALAGMPDCICR